MGWSPYRRQRRISAKHIGYMLGTFWPADVARQVQLLERFASFQGITDELGALLTQLVRTQRNFRQRVLPPS